ncbi:MAG: MFS transporter [Coriobacteriia bacterium]|nr:MFS transporter [Coriobacteriia bacterium]
MEKAKKRSGAEALREKRAQGALADGGALDTKPLLAVLFGTAFIAAFNENIINVGLMDIMGEFAVDSITAQWLVTGYMMVTAIVTALVAFLLRRFTLRQVFFAGGIILALGSAVDIIAPNFALLLVARLFQAIGTGIFIPTMMSTVLQVAPRKKLGSYLAIGSCCITFGPAFGPVVSGLMVTLFGWRSMFVPTLVVITALMLAGIAFVKPLGEAKRIALDTLSVALSAAGLTCLIFGLITLTSNLLLAVVLLLAGIALIAVFALRQRRLEHPLLNLEPLRTPRFSIACVLVVVSMMTTFSMSVLLPLYFEGAMGHTAFIAGLLVLIPILVNAGTALLGGRIMDARGEWPLLPGGFLLITVGMAGVAAVAGTIEVVPVVLFACAVYAGVGFVMSPSQTAGLKQLPRELNAHGVALINVFIQVAASAGPSLYMGILASSEASALAGGATQAAAAAQGFEASALVATVVGAIGLITALVYVRLLSRKVPETQPQAAPAGLSLAGVMKSDVFTIRNTRTVAEAVQQMLDHRTSGLPVVDGRGRVVGFVSDGDVMKSLADAGTPVVDLTYSLSVFADDVNFDMRLAHLMNANVMDVATERVVSVDVDTPIERVCTVLGEGRIKKLPVLDRGRLVGTVSRSDVNRALMSAFLAARA